LSIPQRLLDEDRGNVSTSSQKKFVTYPVSQDPESNAVNAMVFDAANVLWCVTDAGLFRGREDSSGNLTFELVEVGTQPITKSPALFDSRGRLWFGVRKVNAPASIISVIASVRKNAAKHSMIGFPARILRPLPKPLMVPLTCAVNRFRLIVMQA